ncbi:MAG: RdgB/HAM1 family non-canonical purine NTP pyrophosphatase [bacterium]|nr:RdgB/HAM1 family non-canonical purine NTP pyrophosphatase [bacterium]
MQVHLATTSAHKLAEFMPLLEGSSLALTAMPEPLDIEETGLTFAENARLKAVTAARHWQVPCLADDSGIAIRALGGRPGIHSARYADTDAARIGRVLGELEGAADRGATFHCALALAWPDGRVVEVEGVVDGAVTLAPRGAGGFGYDPVFEVTGTGLTYAELSADDKNRLSHRAVAVRLLLDRLATPVQSGQPVRAGD